jgi:hypothetical protein
MYGFQLRFSSGIGGICEMPSMLRSRPAAVVAVKRKMHCPVVGIDHAVRSVVCLNKVCVGSREGIPAEYFG